ESSCERGAGEPFANRSWVADDRPRNSLALYRRDAAGRLRNCRLGQVDEEFDAGRARAFAVPEWTGRGFRGRDGVGEVRRDPRALGQIRGLGREDGAAVSERIREQSAVPRRAACEVAQRPGTAGAQGGVGACVLERLSARGECGIQREGVGEVHVAEHWNNAPVVFVRVDLDGAHALGLVIFGLFGFRHEAFPSFGDYPIPGGLRDARGAFRHVPVDEIDGRRGEVETVPGEEAGAPHVEPTGEYAGPHAGKEVHEHEGFTNEFPRRVFRQTGRDRELGDGIVVERQTPFGAELIENPLVFHSLESGVIGRVGVSGMMLRPLHREDYEAAVEEPELFAHPGNAVEDILNIGYRGAGVGVHNTIISNARTMSRVCEQVFENARFSPFPPRWEDRADAAEAVTVLEVPRELRPIRFAALKERVSPLDRLVRHIRETSSLPG